MTVLPDYRSPAIVISIVALSVTPLVLLFFRVYYRGLDFLQMCYLFAISMASTAFSSQLTTAMIAFNRTFFTTCTAGDFVCSQGFPPILRLSSDRYPPRYFYLRCNSEMLREGNRLRTRLSNFQRIHQMDLCSLGLFLSRLCLGLPQPGNNSPFGPAPPCDSPGDIGALPFLPINRV